MAIYELIPHFSHVDGADKNNRFGIALDVKCLLQIHIELTV